VSSLRSRTLRHTTIFTLTLLAIEFLDEFVFGAREAAWPLIRTNLGLSYAQVGLLLGLPSLASSIVEPFLGILMDRSLTTYLPTFLSEEGADLWLAGASLSLLEAGGVVGALLGGAMSDRLGRRLVLFISMLTAPLLMFAFLMIGGWLQFPLLLVMGFTALSVTPVIMALMQESFPENRALANGVYMSFSFVLGSAVVVALGAMGDLFGLRLAFAVSAVITLLGLPLILLLPRK
jgi:MFS transporter, FSR family, fosmidomycin resistance protein